MPRRWVALGARPPPKVTPKYPDRVKIYRDGTDRMPDNVLHKRHVRHIPYETKPWRYTCTRPALQHHRLDICADTFQLPVQPKCTVDRMLGINFAFLIGLQRLHYTYKLLIAAVVSYNIL